MGFIRIIFSSPKRIIQSAFVFLAILAVPITITLIGQRQDLRQRASEPIPVVADNYDTNGNIEGKPGYDAVFDPTQGGWVYVPQSLPDTTDTTYNNNTQASPETGTSIAENFNSQDCGQCGTAGTETIWGLTNCEQNPTYQCPNNGQCTFWNGKYECTYGDVQPPTPTPIRVDYSTSQNQYKITVLKDTTPVPNLNLNFQIYFIGKDPSNPTLLYEIKQSTDPSGKVTFTTPTSISSTYCTEKNISSFYCTSIDNYLGRRFSAKLKIETTGYIFSDTQNETKNLTTGSKELTLQVERFCNPAISCAPPGNNCNYVGGDSCSCGTLVCTQPSLPPIATDTPTPTCTPRPACLDANPKCYIPELESYCPPANTSTRYQCDFDGQDGPDLKDFNVWLTEFKNGSPEKKSDCDKNGIIDIFDYAMWLGEFRSKNASQ